MAMLQTALGISLLIFLHELGHFGVARLFGMRVLRFSVGFGPAIVKRRFGDTEWQLAWVPLGGYVHIHGMGPSEEISEDDTDSYANKPGWQRMLVIFAGPGANWLVAAGCVAIALMMGLGQPDPSAKIGHVYEEGAAASAGLQADDRILSIDGTPLASWEELVEQIETHPGQTLTVTIQRGDRQMTVGVTPQDQGGVGKLGIGNATILERRTPWEALTECLGFTWGLTVRHVSLLWGLVVGEEEGQLSGIPGIVKMVASQAKRGFGQLMQSLAWLSIGLCILNLIPLPALDGGRLFFLILETLRGRRVNEQIEQMTHAVGFILLFGLMIFVSVRDLL